MPRPDRSRDALIDAAATLFRRQGYAATGLNQILDEAGVRPGSLYHHFPQGKQQLAAAAVDGGGAAIEGLLRTLLAKDIPVADIVDRWVDVHIAGLTVDWRDGCPSSRLPPSRSCQHAGPRGVGAGFRRLVHGDRRTIAAGRLVGNRREKHCCRDNLTARGGADTVPGVRRRDTAGGRQICGSAAAAPLDVQADVEYPHRMGERADGEIIHAGPGVPGGGIQRKPAGGLEFGGR